MDSGQFPPHIPESRKQPEQHRDPSEGQTGSGGKKYLPETLSTSDRNPNRLPDYEVSSHGASPSGLSARLPEICPVWFQSHRDILQALSEYQAYFTRPENQLAFLNGDGPCYNPLIITRLRLETIRETESLTDDQKTDIDQWLDAALQQCPIPWRKLPLRLNHLNTDWTPSPQARRFIEFDGDNRAAQRDAGDFIPDWMNQEVLGIPISEVTIGYWNLRNKFCTPGKKFLTIERLKTKDPVLYDWLALFRDPRVGRKAGLTDQQIAVVNQRLSYTDEAINQHLKRKKCNTKSHKYTWQQLPAEPGLYNTVQKELAKGQSASRPSTRKRPAKQPGATPESVAAESLNPDPDNACRPESSTKKRKYSQHQRINNLSKPPIEIDGKIYPYAAEKKFSGEGVLERIKHFGKPHWVNFESALQDQLPPTDRSSVGDRPFSTELSVAPEDFESLEVTSEFASASGISKADHPRVSFAVVIDKLDELRRALYLETRFDKALQLNHQLRTVAKALSTHIHKIYLYKCKLPESKAEDDLNKTGLYSTGYEELGQLVNVAQYYIQQLSGQSQPVREDWQKSRNLLSRLYRTRLCLLDEKPAYHMPFTITQSGLIRTPAAIFYRVSGWKAPEAMPETIDLPLHGLAPVVINQINRLQIKYKDSASVCIAAEARQECQQLLILLDHLVVALKYKSMNSAEAFADFEAMKTLHDDFYNFQQALFHKNHTAMAKALNKRIKSMSDVLQRVTSETGQPGDKG